MTGVAESAAVDSTALDRVLARIHQVPMRLRRFTVTARAARAQHRIGPELADLLVAEGLPSVGRGAHRLFDDYDLGNTALHLGLVSVRRMTMRSWANALRRNSSQPESRLRADVVARCPVPPHDGPCPLWLLREGGRRERLRDGGGPEPVAWFDIRTSGQWPEVPAGARELIGELEDLEFFLLPEAIRWDLDFLLRTRIADCGGAAAWLVREGRRRGLSVRFSFGLLAVKPYSTPHCWAEFLADGVWVPVDPLLLKAMRSWASLDPAQWPAHRSTGAAVHRLCGHFTKVVSHDGTWAPVSLPTDYVK